MCMSPNKSCCLAMQDVKIYWIMVSVLHSFLFKKAASFNCKYVCAAPHAPLKKLREQLP